MDKKLALYIPLIQMLFHPNPSPHQTHSQVLLQETKAENYHDIYSKRFLQIMLLSQIINMYPY